MKVANEKKGIFHFIHIIQYEKEILLRAISIVNVSIKIVSNQLN